jgi:hypothetical protein
MATEEIGPRIRIVDVPPDRPGQARSIWIRADRPARDLEAEIDEWLSESPSGSEGAYVRDHEGFGNATFDGTETLDEISRLAILIRRYGLVSVELLKRLYDGEARHAGHIERIFEEHYLGSYANNDALGRAFAERMGISCNELLEPYVDWTAFVTDAEGEHITTIKDAKGIIHAFTPL